MFGQEKKVTPRNKPQAIRTGAGVLLAAGLTLNAMNSANDIGNLPEPAPMEQTSDQKAEIRETGSFKVENDGTVVQLSNDPNQEVMVGDSQEGLIAPINETNDSERVIMGHRPDGSSIVLPAQDPSK